jgi:hypothetical protein
VKTSHLPSAVVGDDRLGGIGDVDRVDAVAAERGAEVDVLAVGVDPDLARIEG